MPLITEAKSIEKEKIKLDIDSEILNEIRQYCAWANIKDINHFFEEAATYIFSKDKDWNKYLKSYKKEAV